jgi:hypothetical protein
MNTLIEELAKKSNAWFPDSYPSAEGGDEAWRNLVIFSKEDLEKFVHSIVEECSLVLREEAEKIYKFAKEAMENKDYFLQDGLELCAEQCRENEAAIKEHFGIGE